MSNYRDLLINAVNLQTNEYQVLEIIKQWLPANDIQKGQIIEAWYYLKNQIQRGELYCGGFSLQE